MNEDVRSALLDLSETFADCARGAQRLAYESSRTEVNSVAAKRFNDEANTFFRARNLILKRIARLEAADEGNAAKHVDHDSGGEPASGGNVCLAEPGDGSANPPLNKHFIGSLRALAFAWTQRWGKGEDAIIVRMCGKDILDLMSEWEL